MTVHPVKPADLSAYYDGELRGTDRHRIEEHLAACPACRSVLAQYDLLGGAVRSSAPVTVPAAVDHRVMALLRAQGRQTRGSWLSSLSGFTGFRPALAGVAMAALLLVVVMAGLPFGGESGGSRVASAYLSSEDGRPTIQVHFTGPVDRESIQESVRLDPPVEVSVSWRGDTMVVKPVQPLHKASYVLSLKTEGAAGKAAPVAFNLPPAPVSTPQPLPTTPPAALAAPATTTPAASPTSVSTAIPTSQATALPVTPTAQKPTATPGRIYPVVRGFDLLLRAQPAIAASLGTALEAERPVESVVQSFQKGLMIWRSDRKEIYAVVEGWGWRAFQDGFEDSGPAPRTGEPARGFGKVWREQADVRALGAPTSPEARVTIVVQQFERGQLVWTADQSISVLFESGAWDRYPDRFQNPTAVATQVPTGTSTPMPSPTGTPSALPSATPTATVPVASSTPTAAPSPSATATPAAATSTATPEPTSTLPVPEPTATQPTATRPTATQPTATPSATRPVPSPSITPSPTATPQPECAVTPLRGFGLIYGSNPTLATKLGCAQAAEEAVQVVRQTFESGLMMWRSDTREITVIRRDGNWSVHKDSWKESEILADAGTPPAGLAAPIRGFGKLWRDLPEVRRTLGWATGGEQQLVGAAQRFAQGQMLWTADKLIYVLLDGGSWQSFADSYAAPTATARPRD